MKLVLPIDFLFTYYGNSQEWLTLECQSLSTESIHSKEYNHNSTVLLWK